LCGKDTHCLPNHGTTYSELFRKLAFGRKPNAYVQFAAENLVFNRSNNAKHETFLLTDGPEPGLRTFLFRHETRIPPL
jgi:hypothetical protein